MKKLMEQWKYELMAAVIMLAYLIYYIPQITDVTAWTIMPYALSYRLGFISRGLVGSIIRLVIPNLTCKHIYIIILINILLLCGLTLFFMHKILKRAYDVDITGIIFLLGLFLVNPGSIAFLFYWGNYGRFDMFLLMTLLITALFVIYDKCVWLVPVFCIGAVMTHQAFVFQYFPAVLILLFYSGFILKRKYGVSIFAVTLVSTCAMFLYLQFFSRINYSYEDTLAIIDATTDLPALFFKKDMMVKVEYYSSVMETFIPFVWETLGRNIIKSTVYFLFLIPMIKILKNIWKVFVQSRKNIFCRFFPWFVLFAEIPMFVLTCDYGRDYAAIVLCNFILIFSLYALGDAGMKRGIADLTMDLKKNPGKYIFVLVLCAVIGKFQAAEVGELGDRFYALLTMLTE